jgi:RHS repeat-associated protein
MTDHLNSTAMFVDKAGTVADILDDNDMYPWGGVVPGVGRTTSNNTIKFTGQYRDTDTAANLDYFGARYYSNTVGRFMRPDWAAAPTTVPYAKFGDPQSLNLYRYVENGPVNRIDGDGHSSGGVMSVAQGHMPMGEGPVFESALPMGPAPVAAMIGDFKGLLETTYLFDFDFHHEGLCGNACTGQQESGAIAGRGERRHTGRPDGTDDPFKKMKPIPGDPNNVEYKDPHTGKRVTKKKPPGFDEYWKKKHPDQEQPKPTPTPTPEPTSPKPTPMVDWNEVRWWVDGQWREFKRRVNNGELCPCSRPQPHW